MASKNVNGIIWSFVERLGSQIISFVLGIILARLLTPEDYGTIGLLTIFIMLSNVFVESGFGNALIRKLDRTELDCSTAFYFNICVGFILYITLFFSAPLIAAFFETPILTPLTRIVALNILIGAFCIVQRALLTANLDIKIQTKITIFSQFPSGIIAIIMAYYGMGVYSLAVQQVGMQFLSMVILWYVAKWKPRTGFSVISFKYLWGFGSKLVAASFVGVLFDQAYAFIIGKCINKKQLGYYSKAHALAVQPNSIVTGVIQKVIVPVFSIYQNDRELLRRQYRKYIRFLFFITVPISGILLITAEPIILMLYGEKWIPCVWMFRYIIIGGTLLPLGTLNLSLLQVLGKTDYTLRLEFLKKPLYAIVIAIGIAFGIKGILFSLVINAIIGNIVNAYPTRKLIGYGYSKQFYDAGKYILLGVVIGLPLFYIGTLCSNILIYTIVASILYIAIYILFLFISNDSSFNLIYEIIRRKK